MNCLELEVLKGNFSWMNSKIDPNDQQINNLGYLHINKEGLAPNSFLFPMVMDVLTEQERWEVPMSAMTLYYVVRMIET